MWPLFIFAGAALGALTLTTQKAAAATRMSIAPPMAGASRITKPISPEAVDITVRAMKTIRAMESGGDYKAQNKRSSASGAYQFLDTTWGNFCGFKKAKDAPPPIQDWKAAELIAEIQRHLGTDPKWIPAAWYAGIRGARTFDWSQVLPGGNKSSIAQYVTKWLETYRKMS